MLGAELHIFNLLIVIRVGRELVDVGGETNVGVGKQEPPANVETGTADGVQTTTELLQAHHLIRNVGVVVAIPRDTPDERGVTVKDRAALRENESRPHLSSGVWLKSDCSEMSILVLVHRLVLH